MSKIFNKMRPVNRHLLVVPNFRKKEKTSSGVLLPENFQEEKSRFSTVVIIDIADDCSDQFHHLSSKHYSDFREAVVESSMIEEIKVGEKKHYLILENYVVGLLEGAV